MAASTERDKTRVDEAALKVEEFASQASVKVQLDIDDAPFLLDDEPEPPAKPTSTLPQLSSDEDAEAKARAATKRKRMIMAGAAGIVLLILLVAVWFFLFRSAPPDVTPPKLGTTVIVVPSPEKITGPKEIPIAFDPFWVPQRDTTPSTRFLRMRFSSFSFEEKLMREVKDKNLVLRDAIYYYLRNKSHEFLLDPNNVPGIKQDVLDIINNYLTQGKLEDIFIENYIVK